MNEEDNDSEDEGIEDYKIGGYSKKYFYYFQSISIIITHTQISSLFSISLTNLFLSWLATIQCTSARL